jgi:AcrR family transcriptional regulator
MSPRPDVSEERKHQILDAALEVFNRKGIGKTRMDDIVAEAGLSKGALYWYFKSKDEIVTAIFEVMFRHELEILEQLQNTEDSATDRVWDFAEHMILEMNKMLHLMPIAYEFFALAFRSKFMQKIFKEYFNRFMDSLTPIIQQGIDSGEFRQANAREAAIAAGAIFEGTVLLWMYDNTAVEPERHIRSGIKLLLAGIQSQV